MSLEKSVQELTEAVQELTAILRQNTSLVQQPAVDIEVSGLPDAEEMFPNTVIPSTARAEAQVGVGTIVPQAEQGFYPSLLHQMTEAANGFTRDQLLDEGWTDETLISAGMMLPEVVPAPVAPVTAPPLAVAPAPGVPLTPVNPALTPAAALASAEVPATHIDDRGVVWNAEFHSAKQTKDLNGNFKKKRGTDAAAKDTYEAPFLAAPPTPAAPPAAPTPPAEGDFLSQEEADQLSVKMVEISKNLGTSEPVRELLVEFGVENTSQLTRAQADDLDMKLEAL